MHLSALYGDNQYSYALASCTMLLDIVLWFVLQLTTVYFMISELLLLSMVTLSTTQTYNLISTWIQAQTGNKTRKIGDEQRGRSTYIYVSGSTLDIYQLRNSRMMKRDLYIPYHGYLYNDLSPSILEIDVSLFRYWRQLSQS